MHRGAFRRCHASCANVPHAAVRVPGRCELRSGLRLVDGGLVDSRSRGVARRVVSTIRRSGGEQLRSRLGPRRRQCSLPPPKSRPPAPGSACPTAALAPATRNISMCRSRSRRWQPRCCPAISRRKCPDPPRRRCPRTGVRGRASPLAIASASTDLGSRTFHRPGHRNG